MIRLTLILIAAIGVTMVVAGRDPDGQQAGDVGRKGQLASGESAPEAMIPTDQRLDIDDEESAIAMALEAGREAVAEMPAANATEPVEAAASDGSDPWFVTGSRVNLRAGPSTADAVVGQVVFGQEAQVLEQTEDGWVRIRVGESGRDAYIYGRFLSAERPS